MIHVLSHVYDIYTEANKVVWQHTNTGTHHFTVCGRNVIADAHTTKNNLTADTMVIVNKVLLIVKVHV